MSEAADSTGGGGPLPLVSRLAATFSPIAAGVSSVLLALTLCLTAVGLVWPEGETVSPYTELRPAAPVRLVVKALRVDAPIVPVQVGQDAVLDPPRDAHLVGWWDASAKPGSRAGQTVITGHTVQTGGGAMDRIGDLRAGQHVDVVTRAGRMRYEVTEVRELSREQVARQAVDLFGQRGGSGRLVLVTCTDWNGSYYEENVIAFADPLGQPVRRKRTAQAAAR